METCSYNTTLLFLCGLDRMCTVVYSFCLLHKQGEAYLLGMQVEVKVEVYTNKGLFDQGLVVTEGERSSLFGLYLSIYFTIYIFLFQIFYRLSQNLKLVLKPCNCLHFTKILHPFERVYYPPHHTPLCWCWLITSVALVCTETKSSMNSDLTIPVIWPCVGDKIQ